MKPNLNQLIDSFNKLNDQARYGILGGVVFVVLLLDVFLLVLPQMGAISDTNDQIKKMSDDTRQVIDDRGRINQFKKSLKDKREELSVISGKVRPVQEVPMILSTISSIANEYGVKIDQLVPEKDQQESLKEGADGKYIALPVVIKARCGYHRFGSFLNKLENEDLSFIMKDFIIQNDDKNPSRQSYSLTIKIILVDRAAVLSKNL